MNRNFYTTITALTMAVLLSLAWGTVLASGGRPLKPELAAKREMVRKQQEQRVTPEKRKAAAEALKAERMKVYKAKQGLQQTDPTTTGTK